MKKYIFVIIILSSLVLAVGYISSLNSLNQTTNQTPVAPNKTYAANGISFSYPPQWQEVNKTSKYVIAYIKDPKAKSSDDKPGAVVQVSKKASEGIPLERFYDEVRSGASSVPGYEQISDRTIKVDNATAYEFIARAKDEDIEEQYKVVLFEKRGFIYMIACGTRSPTSLIDEEKNFDMIINSFKIQ